MAAESFVGTRLREYEILEELGQGGMGAVYKARHIYLQKERAIKLIRNIHAEDPDLSDRFVREAKILSELDHPNLVRLYEFGKLDDHTFFMVQEYVKGESVYHRMQRVGKIPVEDSIKIIKQAAIGLGSAHRKGTIHRDISPDNLMIIQGESEEITKVIDFGIAKPLMEGTRQYTATNTFIGKPQYCSPEQSGVLGQELSIDHRTDIYSLAITLYYMLVGKLPFHSPTPLGYLVKHAMEQPKPLLAHEFSDHIPHAMDRLVLKALSKDREQRHSSMEAFVIELDEISSNQTVSMSDDFSALFENGKRHYDKKEWREAIAYWKRALQISPADENLKQWIHHAESQHQFNVEQLQAPPPSSFGTVPAPAPPFPPPVAPHSQLSTIPAPPSRSRLYVVLGATLLGLFIVGLIAYRLWNSVQEPSVVVLETSTNGPGGIDDPVRMEIGNTYTVELSKNQQYYFKISLPAGEFNLIEDTHQSDNEITNLMSNLSILDAFGASLQDRAISFNEVDSGFRGTYRFTQKAASDVGFRISNDHDAAKYWLTVQKADDSRLVPFFGQIVPKRIELEEAATGSLEKGDSAYYLLKLEKGQYTAVWDFTNSERQKTNLQGYLALLDPDGGNQQKLSELNEVDVTSRMSGPFSLPEEKTVILRISNRIYAVHYALKVKRVS